MIKIIAYSLMTITLGSALAAEPVKNIEAPVKEAKLKDNQRGIPVEVPVIAVPEEIKSFVMNLGSFVEYQRVCKNTPASKKEFQEYLRAKENSVHLIYGLAPLDYRTILEQGANDAQKAYEALSTADQKQICKNFNESFPKYLADAKEGLKLQEVTLIDLNKEPGIKKMLESKYGIKPDATKLTEPAEAGKTSIKKDKK